MKQRITVEQLAELTPEQQGRLRAWWKPEDGDWFADYEKDECVVLKDEVVSWHCPDNNCLPLLSIGQCIELAYYCKPTTPLHIPIRGEKENPKTFYAAGGGDVEILDALWQVVKEVL